MTDDPRTVILYFLFGDVSKTDCNSVSKSNSNNFRIQISEFC